MLSCSAPAFSSATEQGEELRWYSGVAGRQLKLRNIYL